MSIPGGGEEQMTPLNKTMIKKKVGEHYFNLSSLEK